MRIYYAHPINLYGSPTEDRDKALLAAAGFTVINPSDEDKIEGYKREGMEFFFRLVSDPETEGSAFRAMADGFIGAGVYGEITKVAELGKPVYEIPCALTRRVMPAEMSECLDEVVFEEMEGFVLFTALDDWSLPFEAGRTIRALQAQGIPVLERPILLEERALTVEQTREYLSDVGQR